MQAMIFAAGLGTRLQPLTNDKPKAMVEINGKPMLEWLILKLKKFGYNRIVINTHHFADLIHNFISKNNNFGIEIIISHEKDLLLDTGGGLQNASKYFDLSKPILVHNVDIITNLDLRKLLAFHLESNNIATLFVRNRETSRYLLFDNNNILKGWINKNTGDKILVDSENQDLKELAFNGVHIISPKMFSKFSSTGKFSIIPEYLQIAKTNTIKGYEDNSCYYLDIGKIDSLKKAEKDAYKNIGIS